MIVKKRYLTIVNPNREILADHEEKGNYQQLDDAVKHATRLAQAGVAAALVVSKRTPFDAYNDWLIHYYVAHDPRDETGYCVVLDVDVKSQVAAS